MTFGRAAAISVPPGAVVLGDPVDLWFPALADLAVSLYLPEESPGATLHGLALMPTYVSPAGDFAAEAALSVEATTGSWCFQAGIDVAAEPTPATRRTRRRFDRRRVRRVVGELRALARRAGRRLLAEYVPGDHLHLNDAGYRAMGEAVDPALFGEGEG